MGKEEMAPFIAGAIIFGVPGLIILITGIRTLVTKQILGLTRNRFGFGWLLPKMIRGEDAETIGKFDIGIGSFLLVIALIIVIGMFV
jgi:hypothetical protein